MAQTWDFNPGGCCCDDEAPPTACCPIESMPTTLYLTDSFGTVTLTYNGTETTPTTSTTSWWGCALRPASQVRNFNSPPASDCTTPGTSGDVPVHFQLFCNIGFPAGYFLALHFPVCTDTSTNRIYLANHPTYSCSSPSTPTSYGIGSSSTKSNPTLASDCSPFALSIDSFFQAPGPVQDADRAYYIYGSSEVFTITE